MTPKFKIGDIVIYKRKLGNYNISSILSIDIEDREIVYYLSNNILVPENHLKLYNDEKKEEFND